VPQMSAASAIPTGAVEPHVAVWERNGRWAAHTVRMKRFLTVGLIVLCAAGLTGCSFAGQPDRVDPAPTAEPLGIDPTEWDQSVTLDQFADAFPELDTTALATIEGITVQNNTRMWVLGTSDSDHSYEKAVTWAEGYVELEPDEDMDMVTGTYSDDGRSVTIDIRQVGDNSDTAGFLLYVTSSI
jgi:hypothetical protein